MTAKQVMLLSGMCVVLGLVFVRVGQLKANVVPLRDVIKEREEREDRIRFQATAPILKTVHDRILKLRSDYPEIAGYSDANLFLLNKHKPHWYQERKIFFDSLLQNNDKPASDGLKLTVQFCGRRGPLSYCHFGRDFSQHYLWQESKLGYLKTSLSCSIDTNNIELLHTISRICEEEAGGTMEIVRQRNIRTQRTSK